MKIIATLFVLSGAVGLNVHAADDFKIAVIDMQKAIQSSEAGKKARSEIETALNKKKKEIEAEEAAIKKSVDDFQKQQAALSDSAKQKKQQELQERYMKYQESREKSKIEFQKREQELSEPIVKKIRQAVAEVSKEKGYRMTLEKNEQVVIYSEERDDITDAVLKKLK